MGGEWRELVDAPVGRPVRVWASYDPSNPLMSWRTFTAVQKYRGWWFAWGNAGLKLYPSHWTELAPPPNPGAPLPAPGADRRALSDEGTGGVG